MAITSRIASEVLQQIIESTPGHEVVGIIASVVDDVECWQGGAGYADLETQSPTSTAGYFRIGSISKMFVAVAVLQLVEQGNLQLEDVVQHHLPNILPGSMPPITVRQLLQHTSGLASYEMEAGFGDPEVVLRDRLRTWTPTEIIGLSLQQPRAFQPGEGQLYSDTNYILLGLLMEAVTGEPYHLQIERGILQPLDMRKTFFPGTDPYLPEPHGQGYITVTRDGQAVLADVTEWNPSIAWAAGEIVSTLEDMDKFLAGLLGGQLMAQPLLDQMLRPAPGMEIAPGAGYGLGIGMLDLPGGVTIYTHGGGVPGYLSSVFANRDGTKRVIVSATITFPGERPVPAISRLVLILFGNPPSGS